MAKQINFRHNEKTKVKRRRKKRPLNHRKKLGKKRNIGMVYEVYTILMGGRQIKKARVASFKDTFHYEILVLELKLVSKAK